jgi:ubiquilin
MMLQMSAMMQEGGVGGGSPFGNNGFPAPGNPGGFPAPGTPGNASNDASSPTSGAPPAHPPFASMFGPGAGASGATTGGVGGAGGFDPAALQQLFGGAAGGGAANPFGAFGGASAPAAPADTRSPEERFQVQLQVSCLPWILRAHLIRYLCIYSN